MRIVIFLLLILSTSCSNKIAKKLVTDSITTKNFYPSVVNHNIAEDLFIEISPVKSTILDSLTFALAIHNGNYQNELFPKFEAAKSKNASLKPKFRDRNIVVKNRAFKAVDQLVKQDRISDEDGVRLK